MGVMRTALAIGSAGTLALAGCGGGGGATSSATQRQLTMAQVCASHAEDVGHIAAGIVAFKYAMDTENTAAFTLDIATTVKEAVSDLQNAAVGATSTNLEAMRRFLQLLQNLSEHLANPPTHPTAIIGNEDVAEIEHAAGQVGCKV